MDELQRVAQALADRTGRAIAIDDPQMNLICHTAHDDRVDSHRVASVMKMRAPDEVVAHAFAQGIATADGPVRVPGLPEIELLPRICFPVRCQGLLFGYLWIIEPDGGPPTTRWRPQQTPPLMWDRCSTASGSSTTCATAASASC